MDSFARDICYGLRALGRRPGFAAVAALTLALGIGATTSIFSVVHAVVLRPLPYDEPAELVYLGADRGGSLRSLSAPEYLFLRDELRSFEHLATWREVGLNLVDGGEPERVPSARITANLLPLLRVQPMLGRNFTSEEDREGNDRVVLLSHGFWQRRFAGTRDILGRELQLDGRRHLVVGILPESFSFPNSDVELFVPMAITESELDNPGAHSLIAIGRLADGIGALEALAEARPLSERRTAELGEDHRGSHGVVVRSMHAEQIRDYRSSLTLLFGAVGFVLLIACANVANLLLARATEREKELAVRAALGAGRGRLIRQLLTESLLLSFSAGLLGLLFAVWSLYGIVRFGPSEIPRLQTTAIDFEVFGFVVVVSLLTGLVFGTIPAFKTTRVPLEAALTRSTRGSVSALSGERSRRLLVVAEVALALVLLVGAGLLLRSFWLLSHVDPGFDPRRLLTVRLGLPQARYGESEQQRDFARRLDEGLESVPGVEAAGLISPMPLTGSVWTLSVEFPGGEQEETEEPMTANWRTVSPGYFRASGIPLIRGRAFTRSDGLSLDPEDGEHPDGRSVLVVNETFARRHWPREDALGKIVRVGYDNILCEIVGIVGDVKHEGLAADPGEEMYTPFEATPWPRFDLAIRVAVGVEPSSIIDSVRAAVRDIDSQLPIYDVQAMPELVARSIAPQRFLMVLMGTFAAAALLLAATGIYGVISYSVAQRTREIGLRMALGAHAPQVLKLVVIQGAKLLALGATLGLVSTLLLLSALSSELYGISATDPSTYLGVAAVLFLVGLTAVFVPAFRAARLDPIVALRYE